MEIKDSFGLLNSDGPTALNSYGRPGGSYVNSKRARKMSAFMPMRGRKDGRELAGHYQQQLDGQFEGNNYYEGLIGASRRPLRELPEPMDDDVSLARSTIGQAEDYDAGASRLSGGLDNVPRQTDLGDRTRRGFTPMRGKRSLANIIPMGAEIAIPSVGVDLWPAGGQQAAEF